MTETETNPFPDESEVWVPFPAPHMTAATPRSQWPWLHGVVESRGDADEWFICVDDPLVAELADGSAAPPETPEDQQYHPMCFRTSCEILRAGYQATPSSRPDRIPEGDDHR